MITFVWQIKKLLIVEFPKKGGGGLQNQYGFPHAALRPTFPQAHLIMADCRKILRECAERLISTADWLSINSTTDYQ